MNSLKTHARHFNINEQLPTEPLTADVVVIGTGAGGGIAADKLSQAGLEVILLEEGPLRTAEDFKMLESKAYPELYQEATARKSKDKGIVVLQGRNVGGSTTVNWTSSFRTPKQTLEHWQQEFGVTDLSSEQMLPWFEQVESMLSISPWAIPPNANNKVLLDGAHKLGWSAQVIPRNVRGCANLGYCGMGCPLDAKQSMLVTTIPAAVERGATLLSQARCEKLLTKNNQVSGLLIRAMDPYGRPARASLKINCRYVVLAAGAIGSPAIMLRSRLEDPYRLIGRRTFLHPVTAVAADMPQPINPFSGAPQSVYSDEFLWREGVTGRAGYKLEVPPIHPVMGSSIIPLHGDEHAEVMKGLPHLHAALALLRDGFHNDSQGGQVELDKDSNPLLDYPLNDYIWEGVTHAMLTMAELQFAAGAHRVRPMHLDAQWSSRWSQAKQAIAELKQKRVRTQMMSAHVMGGCAMGGDESRSLVDNQGQFRYLDNLWVMDASIFPTSLGVNPQLTIYALVSKLASQLADRLQ